ncbi:MAG: DUF4258 domain-containing protein [Candidatus Poribacteria bacterium]
MKTIRFSKHAKEQLAFRDATEDEVIETIETFDWKPTELGRLECRKDFLYRKIWNKKFYEIKQVRPIFVEEDDEIIVVTVYTYFFQAGVMRDANNL